MSQQMPQEIEVWYIIPAIRREFAKTLIKEHGLTQKEVANILGLTEAAVSQYLKSKRAKEVVFNNNIISEIKKSVKVIFNDKEKLMEETHRIINLIKVKKIVCDIHKTHDKVLKACKICFK
jgi:hypothetical protein